MEELVNNYSLSDIMIGCFFIGMLFNVIQDIICSLIGYLQEKAWRVNDYEKLIYNLYRYSPNHLVDECHKIPGFKYELLECIDRFEEKEKKKEKLNKFLNKFKRGTSNE